MDKATQFNYVYSCDLNSEIQIKIGTLEGDRLRFNYAQLCDNPLLAYSGIAEEGFSDLFVSCEVLCDGRSLAEITQTSYKSFTSRWSWNEWLVLPVKYSDILLNTKLVFTIWDYIGLDKKQCIGTASIDLFNNASVLQQGIHDLPVILNDGQDEAAEVNEESTRLVELIQKHREGHIARLDWLDRLTFSTIQHIQNKEKKHSQQMYLMIEFAKVFHDGNAYSVVYFEKGGDKVYEQVVRAEIVGIPDLEIFQENLVEAKHHKLVRSSRSEQADRELKPNISVRDQLNTIINKPCTVALTSEDTDLIWKFRFYLSNQSKALTKFLRSVSWNSVQESKQALELMSEWSRLEPSEALELLSPKFTHPVVRHYAVSCLQDAQDQELLLYLLQLVQALKYEDYENIVRHKNLLVGGASKGEENMSSELEAQACEFEGTDYISHDALRGALEEDEQERRLAEQDNMDLGTFLIQRSCCNFELANYFYWYVRVEAEEQSSKGSVGPGGGTDETRYIRLYRSVLARFSYSMLSGTRTVRQRSALSGQEQFYKHLSDVVRVVAGERGNREKKVEKLRMELSNQSRDFKFFSFNPFPLPLDPSLIVCGIIPGEASLFNSALMPCRLTFKTDNGGRYVAIFKHGDDLRQDQLVLQMISLMDKLLRKENLDLKLTPYKVLAVGNNKGFVQFIEAQPVAQIIELDGSILNFLRRVAPSPTAQLGVAMEAMDNYIKSCAGYCVITYLITVGDRHLDNLLMTNSGKLFHIDFGYILGRDPKPMPPPMKLSREMVEAMGGETHDLFRQFKKHCYTCFLCLRRSANLILNLFSLMIDANVPDIALEPDKTVRKVEDKFRLDLSDEEAVSMISCLIDESVSATMPALMEKFHKVAQYWR